MSKPLPSTYLFPTSLQKEFHQLMKSKENFLKNLPDVERHKLTTLYARLQDVWNQNNIEQLQETLNLKYQELREIQKQIENLTIIKERTTNFISKTYAETYEKELIQNTEREEKILKKDSDFLKSKKKNFFNTMNNGTKKTNQILIILERELDEQSRKNIEAEENQLKKDVEIWKSDIIEKQLRLKEYENQVKELSETFTNKSQILEEILTEQENESTILSQKKTDWMIKSQILNDLKMQREMVSLENKKAEKILKTNLENLELTLRKELKEKESHLKKDIAIFINKSKKQLKQEYLKEMNIPEDLKTYLLTWETSTISSPLKRITEDTKKRGNALRQRLTYIGMTEQHFFELMDKYDK